MSRSNQQVRGSDDREGKQIVITLVLLYMEGVLA